MINLYENIINAKYYFFYMEALLVIKKGKKKKKKKKNIFHPISLYSKNIFLN